MAVKKHYLFSYKKITQTVLGCCWLDRGQESLYSYLVALGTSFPVPKNPEDLLEEQELVYFAHFS